MQCSVRQPQAEMFAVPEQWWCFTWFTSRCVDGKSRPRHHYRLHLAMGIELGFPWAIHRVLVSDRFQYNLFEGLHTHMPAILFTSNEPCRAHSSWCWWVRGCREGTCAHIRALRCSWGQDRLGSPRCRRCWPLQWPQLQISGGLTLLLCAGAEIDIFIKLQAKDPIKYDWFYWDAGQFKIFGWSYSVYCCTQWRAPHIHEAVGGSAQSSAGTAARSLTKQLQQVHHNLSWHVHLKHCGKAFFLESYPALLAWQNCIALTHKTGDCHYLYSRMYSQ